MGLWHGGRSPDAVHPPAADAYVRSTGDMKVSVFQLPDTTDETMGSRYHPGRLAHERAAKELIGYIKGLLQ